MINIRSVTWMLNSDYSEKEFEIIEKVNLKFDNSEFFVRTKRATLPCISEPLDLKNIDYLNSLCLTHDIRWFNIPIIPSNNKKIWQFAYNILKNYEQSFVNILAVQDGKINYQILDESLKLIKKTSNISINGKDNFRLGLSVNVKPNCPFFPFSISDGKFGFSIALELTQDINMIICNNSKLNLNELRTNIINTLYPQIKKIEKLANEEALKYNIEFKGFDFSLAPIIDDNNNGSIITILNYLGVNDFSKSGTLFATAYLTNILKYFSSEFKSVGFSGVMYSLLEDVELCKINNEIGVDIEDLIKLSTMCGCGIDMIPISCDEKDSNIKSTFMDVIAISTRLNKPLGIRILPIPRARKGVLHYTNFNEDADFISNTKVLTLATNEIIEKNIDYFEFLKIK